MDLDFESPILALFDNFWPKIYLIMYPSLENLTTYLTINFTYWFFFYLGALKRDDPDRPEDQVLMRALRDFNLPKIICDDNPVFLGLISDLFPSLDVPRKRDLEFEKAVKHAACDLKLQPEESFVLKIVQLEELLFVRHSVFIVGN